MSGEDVSTGCACGNGTKDSPENNLENKKGCTGCNCLGKKSETKPASYTWKRGKNGWEYYIDAETTKVKGAVCPGEGVLFTVVIDNCNYRDGKQFLDRLWAIKWLIWAINTATPVLAAPCDVPGPEGTVYHWVEKDSRHFCIDSRTAEVFGRIDSSDFLPFRATCVLGDLEEAEFFDFDRAKAWLEKHIRDFIDHRFSRLIVAEKTDDRGDIY
jgi:hypothetical protein